MLKLLTQLAPVLVLLFPAVQCWTYSRGISAADTQILAMEQEKADLERQIDVLQVIKSTEDKRTADAYSELEVRLDRNKVLLKEAKQAAEKLALVKSLMQKYAEISEKLDSFKSQHRFLDSRKP